MMKSFIKLSDVQDVPALVDKALNIKKNPHQFADTGKGKSMCLIFLNPSLRTRLSAQKAAANIGLHTMTLDVGSQGWKLEFEDGVVMNGDKAEHIKEAAAVIGSYVDMVAIRAFAGLKNREQDQREEVISAFRRYCGVPVINMESATGHPLQALADMMTIRAHQKSGKPKIVLSWAPHPQPLPQAVANSFAEWAVASGHELVITHPEGYELDEKFTSGAKIEYNQKKAFEEAGFIYAKNWSSVRHYGQVLTRDPSWMITQEKMKVTNQAQFMHCLPVRRNVVVEDAVLDSENSLVIEQAQNRVYSMQAVLAEILKAQT